MKKITSRFASVLTRTLTAALILNLLTGCSMAGSQGASASQNASKSQNASESQDASASAKTDAASDAKDSASDASASGAAVSGTSADSAENGISIRFSNDGITAANDSGLSIDGTSLTITAAGTYLLSGSCEDGSVKVQKGTTGVVLVLDGLTLSSQTTAPLICAKSTEVTIEAAAGTVNTLSDTEANNDGSEDSNTENAVIKCKDGSQVVLCGTGELILRANGKNGIKSGASTETEGDASLTIRELTLTIDAPVNDAVNAESILNVESGTLEISAGDDALHSDGELNIGADGTDGPSISITSCYEGLEGTVVNIFSGDIDLQSTDDCINAANSDQPNGDFQINITGGSITASTSNGDGFDSNGDLIISGGSVAVWTANAADNEPLDADGTVTISGGTVLAAGESSGMGIHLEASQPCVIFSGDSSEGGGFRQTALLTNGSSFSILSDDQTTLYSAEAMCSASYIIFSSPDLTESASCTLPPKIRKQQAPHSPDPFPPEWDEEAASRALEISKKLTAKGLRENVRRAILPPGKGTDSSLATILPQGKTMNSPKEIPQPKKEMNSPTAPKPIRQLQNDRKSGWNPKTRVEAIVLLPPLFHHYGKMPLVIITKRAAAFRQLLSDIRFSIAFCDSTLKLYLYASYAINHQ